MREEKPVYIFKIINYRSNAAFTECLNVIKKNSLIGELEFR